MPVSPEKLQLVVQLIVLVVVTVSVTLDWESQSLLAKKIVELVETMFVILTPKILGCVQKIVVIVEMEFATGTEQKTRFLVNSTVVRVSAEMADVQLENLQQLVLQIVFLPIQTMLKLLKST
jgi:hypothetical protein